MADEPDQPPLTPAPVDPSRLISRGRDVPPLPDVFPPQPAPKPLPSNPLPPHLRPRLKLAATSGDGMPLGASLTPPTPLPLPARGSGVLLFINLVAALIAITFALLLAFKL